MIPEVRTKIYPYGCCEVESVNNDAASALFRHLIEWESDIIVYLFIAAFDIAGLIKVLILIILFSFCFSSLLASILLAVYALGEFELNYEQID